MNWLVYHVASGDAFFSGIGLLLVAAALSMRSNTFSRRVCLVSFLVGLISIVVSSTAIPYWYYALASVVTLGWVICRVSHRGQEWSAIGLAAIWLIAGLLELPYHFTPALRSTPNQAITVIGDSVTAGVGGDETSQTWPNILVREHHIHV